MSVGQHASTPPAPTNGADARVDGAVYGNEFLLIIGGLVVGFLSQSLRLMEVERDQALRASVTDAERARLARAVHDGVLQVLALIQRRGRELGGESAELGRMAGEHADKAGVERLIVTHVPPWNSRQVAADEAALAFDGTIDVATPGAQFTI